ncbi:CHAT domain-containing protein [Actinoplanes sp. NPDC051494]|uniref:CHAT domain-containing protein n=1 Tax=Actinoplanes sp. NPDC051494 TaxID=3363907 RepID=UPI0037A54435
MAGTGQSWRAAAQDALDAVQRDPREALTIGRSVDAGSGDDGERSVAVRALGLAYRELNDLPRAVTHLRRAVRLATGAGSAELTALARMSLGYVLANSGRNAAALREVTAALNDLTGLDAGRARMQRGVVLHYAGRYEEAARDYTAAIEIARREHEPLLEARARNNRGLCRTRRGMARGGDDLRRAEEIFTALGLDLAATDTRWNLGTAAARRGDVAVALRAYAEADRRYRELDVPRPALALDRVELLLSVPLPAEATGTADVAVRELRARGMDSDLAEALLAQARAALAGGDHVAAAGLAHDAGAALRRQGRPAWAALARAVELQACGAGGTLTVASLAGMRRTAGQLDATGWPGQALTVRIAAARLATASGRDREARTLLTRAAQARRGGTAARRAQGWLAAALLHRLDGDDGGALKALRRGLDVLDSHRAWYGATELRTSSGAQGRDLAAEGLAIALGPAGGGGADRGGADRGGAGRAARVLDWAERWRANALRMTPVVAPADPELAAVLTELRGASAAVDAATLAGQPAVADRRRQRVLEQRVRELTRQAAGAGTLTRPPGVAELAAALGDAVLVELIAHRGGILAVVVRDGRAGLHRLGALADVRNCSRQHRFALRRLITLPDPAAAWAAARQAADALDRQLLAPIRDRIGDRPLVVAPIGDLHALAWAALPSCAGRPVTVVPSAASWLRARTAAPSGTGSTVLVAGPRLPEGEREVAALARLHPGATVLTGDAARAAAVTRHMGGARLAHVAAHGTFRADAPLLSTIELADGPLTAYEMEGLARPAEIVVLSACDSGLSAVQPGDEVLGLGAVLLGAGTRTLIASVLPVPAGRTADLMIGLNERLRAGAGPAVALAGAQLDLTRDGDPLSCATAAAFRSIGAG